MAKPTIKKALLISLLSGLLIYFVDYYVWTKYPGNEIMDSAVVGFLVFIIAFVGMVL